MKTRITIAFAAALAGGVMIGCAGSPEQQMEEAYAALAAADSVEADQYVPELYMAAQDSFAAAHAEVEGQEGAGEKPDYTHAKSLLTFVIATANDAVAQVPARKEEVRIETDSLITQAQTRLASVQEAVAANPPAAASVSVVNLEETSLSAQTALQQAVEAQATGQYAQAYELVRVALSEIESVEAQLAANATPAAPRS